MKKLIKNAKRYLGRLRQAVEVIYHRTQMRLLGLRRAPTRDPNNTILFWVPGGMPMMLEVEGAIASALRLRGNRVHAIICDGVFRACVKREIKDKVPIEEWAKACPACVVETRNTLRSMAIPYSFIGDYVDHGVRRDLWDQTRDVTWDSLDSLSFGDINVGTNARSAVIRYLQGFVNENSPQLVREYAFSTLITAAAAQQALNKHGAHQVFMSHGTYAEWGPALRTAVARSIRLTAWMVSYLKARFYFRHVEDAIRIDFHNMSSMAWQKWSERPLSAVQEESLDDYMHRRYQKGISFDMRRFKAYSGNIEGLRKKYGLDNGRPVWGIMAHINWDCVSDYSPMAYESFNAWVVDTVKVISEITAVNWIIKVHPAESWDNPESGIERLIKSQYPALPPHIRVFTAEEDVSPLEFYQLVDGGVTVYGTAGLELAMLGRPVICAGEAHYGGKGFTHDGVTPEAYRALLRKAPMLGKLGSHETQLARRYAYVYFMRRQIPLAVVNDPVAKWWAFRFEKRGKLLPGNDRFVDFICDRILDGQDFIMDDSLADNIDRPERGIE